MTSSMVFNNSDLEESNFTSDELVNAYDELFTHSAYKKILRKYKDYCDEEIVSFHVQVSAKEAFEGPDALEWIMADDKERLSLIAKNCWRPIPIPFHYIPFHSIPIPFVIPIWTTYF